MKLDSNNNQETVYFMLSLTFVIYKNTPSKYALIITYKILLYRLRDF